jgi:molecular chaperone GrpE
MKKSKSAARPEESPVDPAALHIQPEAELEAGQADNDNSRQPAEETAQESQAAEPVTEEAAEQVPPDPCQALKDSFAARERDFAILTDNYLRLAAEYDNYRKRSQKEKENLFSDSVAMVIREILPILDNLDRAEISASQYKHAESRKIAEGIAIIQRSVEDVLARLNVSRIDCCGKPFDPELHEAVIHVEDDQIGASTVVEELRKGYRRDDKVIRPCLVKVAN